MIQALEQWQVGIYPVSNKQESDPLFDNEDLAIKHAVKLAEADENTIIGIWYVYWGGSDLEYLVSSDGVYKRW